MWALVTEPGAVATGSKVQLECKHPVATAPGSVSDGRGQIVDRIRRKNYRDRVKKYLIIVEKTETGYSAFSPDVPGCGSTGKTKDEVERNIQEAIEFHLEGLRVEGHEVLENSSKSLVG